MKIDVKRVLIVGDLHGDDTFTSKCFGEAHKKSADAILQVGDFGHWPRNGKCGFEGCVARCTVNYGITFYWLPGNHENYDSIDQFEPGPDGTTQVAHNVFYLPRGYSWDWNGKKFLACGGAISIDQYHRTLGKDWWPQEQIQPKDLEACYNVGKVDYLFTHEAPFEKISDIDDRYTSKWLGESMENNCLWQRKAVGSIIDICQPSEMFHGHHHVRYDRDFSTSGGVCKVHGLGANVGRSVDLATYLLDLSEGVQ